MTGAEPLNAEEYFLIGSLIGEIFYYTFYDVNDFDYPDITIEYPPEFDDEFN